MRVCPYAVGTRLNGRVDRVHDGFTDLRAASDDDHAGFVNPYGGIAFFTSGFRSLFHGAPNMDTLVALGSAAAFGWSTVNL